MLEPVAPCTLRLDVAGHRVPSAGSGLTGFSHPSYSQPCEVEVRGVEKCKGLLNNLQSEQPRGIAEVSRLQIM